MKKLKSGWSIVNKADIINIAYSSPQRVKLDLDSPKTDVAKIFKHFCTNYQFKVKYEHELCPIFEALGLMVSYESRWAERWTMTRSITSKGRQILNSKI